MAYSAQSIHVARAVKTMNSHHFVWTIKAKRFLRSYIFTYKLYVLRSFCQQQLSFHSFDITAGTCNLSENRIYRMDPGPAWIGVAKRRANRRL